MSHLRTLDCDSIAFTCDVAEKDRDSLMNLKSVEDRGLRYGLDLGKNYKLKVTDSNGVNITGLLPAPPSTVEADRM